MQLIIKNNSSDFENTFLEKIFLNTKKSIIESCFPEEIKKEFLNFLDFDSINKENFKRILEIMKNFGWEEKLFDYDEYLLKENFYKNSVKIFFKIWEKMHKELFW